MAKVWKSCSLFFFISFAMMVPLVVKAAAPPPVYIFGDSTVDVGTNDFIPDCRARADIPFNGIDFPDSKPTGRFSNGYNTADLIVRQMGYDKSPPPYLYLIHNQTSMFKRNLLEGVNFASGGSGIFDHTGYAPYTRVVSMGEQIQQFRDVYGNITEVMGQLTTTLLSNSIFLFSVGSNDIFEYLANPNEAHNQTEFIIAIIDYYHIHLQNLLDLGARIFGIVSVPPLGCCPYVRLANNGSCLDEMNLYAQTFHTSMKDLLSNLSLDYDGMKYSLGNAYEMTMDIVQNPLVFGIKESITACCGNGTLNAEEACLPTGKVCLNREEHLFWDRFHPTQTVSELAALTLYGGSPRFVSPVNFSHIFSLANF